MSLKILQQVHNEYQISEILIDSYESQPGGGHALQSVPQSL